MFERRLSALMFLTALALTLVGSLVVAEGEKGLSITVRSADGSQKDMPFYSGYYALVVGCSDYQDPNARPGELKWDKLSYPVNDAKAVAKMLCEIGWEVKLVLAPSGRSSAGLVELEAGVGRDSQKTIAFKSR